MFRLFTFFSIFSEGDLFIIRAAAYLHDISDHKFNGGDFNAGARAAHAILAELDCPEEDISRITYIIDRVSFKGANVPDSMDCIEGKIVQDADRLDAIGAIGITRTFAFGGNRDREIYNPDVPPLMANSPAEYANAKSHTVNHFYEKLFLLRDRLNTEEGRRIGHQRHAFMTGFLREFYDEWDITADAAPEAFSQFTVAQE